MFSACENMHVTQTTCGRCDHLRELHFVVHEVCKVKGVTMLHASVPSGRVEVWDSCQLNLADELSAEDANVGMCVPTDVVSVSQNEWEADAFEDRNQAIDLVAYWLSDTTCDAGFCCANFVEAPDHDDGGIAVRHGVGVRECC